MRASIILVAAAVLAAPAHAWWAGGHMLTAQVAKDCGIMSADTYEQAEAIIAELASYWPNSPEFITSAVWADDLKSQGASTEATFHYIDIPITDPNAPPPAPAPQPPLANVAWAIGQAHSTVTAARTTLLDKSRQLRFITHFVGDVHQPLHAAEYFSADFPNGDAGGNGWFIAGVSYANNLHSLWDSGVGQWVGNLVRPLNATGVAWLEAFSASIMALHPQTDPSIAPLILDSNPMAWANESNVIADTFVYTAPQDPTPVPQAYLTEGGAIALKQIAIGGYRLATLVEYIFSSSDERSVQWREEAAAQLATARTQRSKKHLRRRSPSRGE